MPIVHVNVWKGFGEEKAKVVIHNITNENFEKPY
jgi:hypothetical protein